MSNLEQVVPYLPDEKKSVTDESVSTPPIDRFIVRPPIDYSSVGAFFHSTWRRFVSLWTRRFILCLLAGQVVSLCITCTNVTTEELTLGNWQLPTTQTFFLYLPLFSFQHGLSF
jgi:solute carrier family 35, member F1/2